MMMCVDLIPPLINYSHLLRVHTRDFAAYTLHTEPDRQRIEFKRGILSLMKHGHFVDICSGNDDDNE